jgi:pre-mRNA cleavage complex 2 protein Pcf11
MYVLDSIVKNIGTPYTLFFGKNLYSTFMDSYASVNDSTRRKMEEMLKTWKEPVPGSIDKNPVFPPDVVRPIENALIKARTSALHAHQEQMRTQHQLFGRGGRPVAPHRNTPTPPNARPQFNQPQPPHTGINGHRPESALGQQAYPQHPVRMPRPASSGALTDLTDLPYSPPNSQGQHRNRSCRPRPLHLSKPHPLVPMVPLLLNLE